MNKCYVHKRTRTCLNVKTKHKKIKKRELKIYIYIYIFSLSTFSSFDDVQIELVELEIDIFAGGRRSRFNRIGFVSFVVVDGFDDVNRRFVIDGTEQGNGISIEQFANKRKTKKKKKKKKNQIKCFSSIRQVFLFFMFYFF